MPQRRYPLRLWTSQDLDNAGTLESGAIDCRTSDPEGLMIRVTNAGAASIKIEVAFSNDGTTFNDYAAQEALVTASVSEWTIPEDYHMVNVPWAPFVKLRVTEVASLDDNVVDAVLWMTEL